MSNNQRNMQSGRVGERPGPPAPFRETAPGILKRTQGGGMISLIGAPFFLAGVYLSLGAAGIASTQTETGGPAIILAPMGLVFLAVGGVLVFGRRWLVLDLRSRSILRQIGLLVPLRTEERPLSEFHAVAISHHVGDAETPETYPVALRASTGKDVAIVAPLQFAESFAAAEYLAQALSLQLVDATTDHETVLSPERIGESLRDRLSRSPAGAPPERPPSMRSNVIETAGRTSIVIPGGGPTLAGYAGLYLPILVFFVAMLFAIPVLMRSSKPLTFICIMLLLFGAPTVYGSVRFMISSKRKGITVTVSSAGLMIEQPGNAKTPFTEIPARDILDVDWSTFESAVASARHSAWPVGAQSSGSDRVLLALRKLVPNPGTIIKSRSGLITIGEGLSSDELRYLAWLIRKVLIG
jgi:hypothetical protein